MTRNELLTKLKHIDDISDDKELNHIYADMALLDYIDDEEITDAYMAIGKWYA